MKIKTQDHDNFTVVQLDGEFDSEFTELFQNVITETAIKHKVGIVLDMAKVTFIDSEGLERLLWARDYSSENNCQLKVVSLEENCKKILEITRLENEFECYDKIENVVKSFA
ncbi:MAG: STAS domain-containing protein [Planctomycetes bacterium]|nr:STAS domain-containing protein [Planctomycetota bacterium]